MMERARGMNDEPLRVRCACGWETSGSEDDVINATTEHGERVHNMRPSRADVLAMVIRESGDGGRGPEESGPQGR